MKQWFITRLVALPGLLSAVAVTLPAVSVKAEAAIWLAGDSTMANYSPERYPQTGWGQVLKKFCKPGVEVKNHAAGGRSAKSFIDEKRWDHIQKGLKKGDYVFIQFGHNDQKGDQARHTDPAGSYRDYLKKYIEDTRARGAYPVLVTSVARRLVEKGNIVNSLGTYPQAMKEVAAETHTPVIDLNSISIRKFNELGPEKAKEVFLHFGPEKYPDNYPKGREDDSHFSEYGATLVAEMVVEDAKKQNLPIAKLLQ